MNRIIYTRPQSTKVTINSPVKMLDHPFVFDKVIANIYKKLRSNDEMKYLDSICELVSDNSKIFYHSADNEYLIYILKLYHFLTTSGLWAGSDVEDTYPHTILLYNWKNNEVYPLDFDLGIGAMIVNMSGKERGFISENGVVKKWTMYDNIYRLYMDLRNPSKRVGFCARVIDKDSSAIYYEQKFAVNTKTLKDFNEYFNVLRTIFNPTNYDIVGFEDIAKKFDKENYEED